MNLELILGDTLEKLKEQPDESVHLVCTSPPYPGVEKMWGKFFAPNNFDNAHLWLDQVWDECVRILKPGCKLVVNVANTGRTPYLPNSSRISMWSRNRSGVEFRGDIIWFKGLIARSTGNDTAWGSWRSPSDIALTETHEYILVFRKDGVRSCKTREPIIDKDDFLKWRNAFWFISPEGAKSVGHIAPFPVEIPKRLITLYTFENETVLDPFVGSGTTGIACAMLNRKCIGIDHDPKSIELSKQRINSALADRGEADRPLKNNLVHVRSFA